MIRGILERCLTAKIFLNIVIIVIWIQRFTELGKAHYMSLFLLQEIGQGGNWRQNY